MPNRNQELMEQVIGLFVHEGHEENIATECSTETIIPHKELKNSSTEKEKRFAHPAFVLRLLRRAQQDEQDTW